MRILVTGGSGYIGTRLMTALGARSEVEETVDLDIRPPRTGLPKVRFVERSVTQDLREVFRERPIDIAMHLAWVVDPMRDARRQREICIGGTNRFLDGCLAGAVKQVFFMSSATAYGANPAHAEPVDESEPLKEEHHFQYSAEKREAEGLCQRFAADTGALLQIARPCLVGGPNVSNYIFRTIDKPVAFRALGYDPPTQIVHEDDCAAALVAIVTSKKAGAFNVAADGAMKLSQAYRRVGARVVALPMPLLMAIVERAWRHGWTRVTEAPPEFLYFIAYPWLVSNRRLKEELGFRLRYTAEHTLDAFVEARRASRA